jgi:hypothetical protein
MTELRRRAEVYASLLADQHRPELALISEFHIIEIAGMLAVSICQEEQKFGICPLDSEMQQLASATANALANLGGEPPGSKYEALISAAIQNYRIKAVPELRPL